MSFEVLVDPAEVAALSAHYGEPLRWSRQLEVSQEGLEEARERVSKRRGEIVLAMPRPQGRVLVHTKDFYPPGSYRLLSGGIKKGEPVEAAAHREIHEETGLPLALLRWLGLVEYEFKRGGENAPFVSYVFLTEPTDRMPQLNDPGERISDFREVEWGELAGIADRLENLPEDWRDWGRYRAIPHRLVLDALR